MIALEQKSQERHADSDTFWSHGVCEYVITVWCIMLQIKKSRKKHEAQNPFSFLIMLLHSQCILKSIPSHVHTHTAYKF